MYMRSALLVTILLSACGEAAAPLKDNPLTEGNEGQGGATEDAPPSDLGGEVTGDDKPTANVVAGCIDGDYAETLPDLTASIDDLIASYDSLGGEEFVMQAMARRYPIGKAIVDGAKDNDFCKSFLTSTGQGAAEDLGGLGMTIHECGHMYDLTKVEKGFDQSAYFITDQLTLTCSGAGGETTTSADNRVFARGRILNDAYQAKHPPCAEGTAGSGCDAYAPEYLLGNYDDAEFDDGDQGFDLLMEEVVQYVNSLASAYAFSDQINPNSFSSDRDGLLNFMWYMQRYLKMGREQYPEDYEFIANDPCWQKLILTTWGRGWLYLEATKDMKNLEIEGAKLKGLVEDPDLMNEIQLVRQRTQCVQ